MVKTKKVNIMVWFERPTSWRGQITVPADFDELDYDEQMDIVEDRIRGKREVEMDYWDYTRGQGAD